MGEKTTHLPFGVAPRKDAADFGPTQNRGSIGGGFHYYIPDVKAAIRKLFATRTFKEDG